MSKQQLKSALEETFASNFVAYYKSHVAHVNVTGRTFSQDHELLQKIYEYFQGNIDTLGEKLRTIRAIMPVDLRTVMELSNIAYGPTEGTSLELFMQMDELLEEMVDQYKDLYEAAEAADYIDISNFAQDQVGHIVKLRWMVEATLDEVHEE